MKKILLILALGLLVSGLVYAADNLWAGEDNSSNTKTGDITYPRPSCWDGATWDRVSCTSVTDLTAVKTAVEIMDDWDEVHDAAVGTDGVLVMGEAHSAQPAAVADADAARLALNVYGQIIMAGYTWATDSIRATLTNPPSSQHSEVVLCDLTNIAQGTTAYCGYIDMDGYKSVSIHCLISATPTDTLTLTVDCSGQDDGTAPASVQYLPCTSAFKELGGNDHNANYVDEEVILASYFDFPIKYLGVKYVTNSGGGNDQDLTCWVKKMF